MGNWGLDTVEKVLSRLPGGSLDINMECDREKNSNHLPRAACMASMSVGRAALDKSIPGKQGVVASKPSSFKISSILNPPFSAGGVTELVELEGPNEKIALLFASTF